MYDRAEHPHNDTISSEGHHQNNPIIGHYLTHIPMTGYYQKSPQ